MNIVKQPAVEIIHQHFDIACELTLNVALDIHPQLMEQLGTFKSLIKVDLGIK